MSSANFEAILARLYTDDAARAEFKSDPEEFAQQYGLDEIESRELCSIDRVGLELAARSYARKRELKVIAEQQRQRFPRFRRLLKNLYIIP